MSDLRFAFLSALLLLPSSACDRIGERGDDEDEDGELVAQVSNDECVSGLKWVGGDEESPNMHPGGDCMGCHESSGEGPTFAIAGTVFELLDEPDECFGFEGATIEIVDAEGREFSLPTNEAGNFYLAESDGPIAMPYRASVVVDGAKRDMISMQASGNCSTCHSASGAQGAPGRVVIP